VWRGQEALMDGTALLAAIFGTAFGAVICYVVIKRRWWKALGSFAIGGVCLLSIVIQGNESHLEHNVLFDAKMILIACFVIAVGADARTWRRTG
jgi:peptidoglycan/LPS O-acetylase OafA/YrhL